MWQRVWIVDQAFKLPEYTFGAQKELCKRCAHLEQVTDTSMACRRASGAGYRTHAGADGDLSTCIDARSPSGDCGPTGRLFAPKQ